MNVTEKKLENSAVELTVVVPEEKVESAYKTAFQKIQKSVRIDGFRKGKAPLQLIEASYKGLADEEAAEILINTTMFEAINEKKLSPITQPVFTYEKISRGASFTYMATFDVMPTVELAAYQGLDATEMTTIVKDDDLETEIRNLLESQADVTPVTDTDAVLETGNLAKVMVRRVDDVDISERDSVQYRDYSLVVDKSRDEFGLDRHIKGMKAGEEREIQIAYPADYKLKDYAGKTVLYQVKLVSISFMKLPELNDDFARKSGYESVDDLKIKTREMLDKYTVTRSKSSVQSVLLDRIISGSSFEIPASMLKQEIGAQLKRRMQAMGIPQDNIDQFYTQIMEHEDEMSEEMRNSLREDAEKTIKNTLVLTEIAKKEGLKVEEERIREVFQKISERVGDSVENVEQRVLDSGMRDNIEHELMLDVAMEYLYNNANIRKLEPVPFEHFVAELR